MTLRRGLNAVGVVLLLTLSACSSIQTTEVIGQRGGLPATAEVEGVPFFPQEKYYCGPAALAMVLAWSGLPVTQADLVSEVYTPTREGSLRSDVVTAARRHGRLAVPVTSLGDLLAEIAAGHPVLVFQNLSFDWLPRWHYAVAFAYDLDSREIVLRSGLNERRVSDLDAFERTWGRGDYWALVVLPPGDLPARAREQSLLRAAAGLERVSRYSEAASAYAAIAKRWPRSYAAYMGLGNALYAAGEFSGAESAYRDAIDRHSNAADAWNNLAYALAAQGRRDEALTAVNNALRLGDANREIYQDTLRAIRR